MIRGQRLRELLASLAVVSLSLSSAGCNQGPARVALAEAEQALSASRPALERYVPTELARIDAEIAEAHARLARGRYTDALRIAQELPGRVAQAAAAADVQRSQLDRVWARLTAEVPAGLDAAAAKLAAGAPAAEEAELAAIRDAWARAKVAYADGDVRGAVQLASQAQTKLAAPANRGMERQ